MRSPDPLEKGSGARGSVPSPSDAEVMELDEGQGPTSDPTWDWREPYFAYLLHDKLPADRTEARRLARRTKSYVLVDGELYK